MALTPVIRIDCPVEGCCGWIVCRLAWDATDRTLIASELHQQTCDCDLSREQLADVLDEADRTARCGGWTDWIEIQSPVRAGVEQRA